METTSTIAKRIKSLIGEDFDELYEQIRKIGEERAKYRALFYGNAGGTSISDERRKILKSEMIKRILSRDGKMAANLVENLAYSEPEYKAFVEEQAQLKIAYETYEAEYAYLKYRFDAAIEKIRFLKREVDIGSDENIN